MKVTKTYSIDDSLYAAFELLATERNINKSSFIEDIIKKYLKDNDMEFLNKIYESKFVPDSFVTVLTQDSTYYMLSDGSKIQKILFMQNFREVQSVQPEEFFKKSETYLKDSIVEKIKKIDVDKIVNDGINTNMTTFKEESITSEIFNTDNSEKELFKIDHNFKNNEYLNYDKTKVCEIIIQLSKMNFKDDKTEKYKELLLKIFKNRKDSMI